VEGPTRDPEILAMRRRRKRSFLTTLVLAQGVPMILSGDELGRTQLGNNNTYAQDNELSWVHWDQADRPLVEFTAALVRLRHEHPTFRRKRFFTGTTVRTGGSTDGGDRLNDIVWLHPEGHPMAEEDWDNGSKTIGMYLNGHGIAGLDERGGTITDDHFLLYFNADDSVEVVLPPEEYADAWDVLVDTGGAPDGTDTCKAGASIQLAPRSVVVLREHAAPVDEPDHSVAASLAAQGPNG
jgi:glycogen operon protein